MGAVETPMTFLRTIFAFCLPVLAGLTAFAGGEEVVVIYNSQMPASKAVAEHYAAARQVLAKQIFGFGLTTNESMTRADFTDLLQQPLAEKLAAAGLWKFAEVAIRDAKGRVETTEVRVVESKIRYAVLCYGVPLKIEPNSMVEEFMDKLIEKFADTVTRDKLRRNEASVDSELAWLPLVKTKIPLTGPLVNPFYLCTNRAARRPHAGNRHAAGGQGDGSGNHRPVGPRLFRRARSAAVRHQLFSRRPVDVWRR
jgi:uncharacterized protein (TIGR03790 family)